MMNTRKIICTGLAFALGMSLILGACGGGGGGGGSNGTSSASGSSSSSSSSSSSGGAIAWNVYNASVLPTASGAVTLADTTPTAFTIAANSGDFTANGNGTISLNSINMAADIPVATLSSVWNALGSYPKSATALLRVLPGITFTLNRTLDLELALADSALPGSRVKMIVSTSGTGVQLEKWDGSASPAAGLPAVDTGSAHTYQLTVTLSSATAGNIKVYVDGASTAVLDVTGSLRATTNPGDNYISFGDTSNTSPYESTLDWLIWTPGAYTPAQLSGKLPSGIGTTTGY